VAGVEDISPRFVVHVTTLLSAGKTAEAVTACRAGVQKYPWYTTGYWVLGKCYEAQGDIPAAHAQYQEVAKRLQGVSSVADALSRTRAAENVAGSQGVTAGTDMEGLLRRLQEARRIQPLPVLEAPLVDMAVPQGEGPIATVTLAEIYAGQGKYREALEAYQKLIQQRPDETGRHAERMAELEKLLQGADKLRQP